MPLFQEEREPLANYDWIDLASATGFIIYDGFNALTSVGDNYILTTHEAAVAATGQSNQGPAQSVNTSIFTATPQACDIDFDLTPFQLPRTIEGTGLVRIPIGNEGAANTNVYVIAILIKESGGETTIVTVQSPTDVVFEANVYYSWTLPLTIPRTHFKKGDILRLTIQIYCGGATAFGLAHNPNDTLTASPVFIAGNSRLTLTIPYKLDFI